MGSHTIPSVSAHESTHVSGGSDSIDSALADAAIPSLATSKITSTRFPLDRLPAMTDEKYWVGTGANVEERDVPGGATKEFSVPATKGNDLQNYTYAFGYRIDAAAEQAFITFDVPADFSSITSATVLRLATYTDTHRLNYYSTYGATGASYQSHQENLLDQEVAETGAYFYEQDISGVLSSLAAGDHVTIRVLGDGTNTPDDLIIEVRFKYA